MPQQGWQSSWDLRRSVLKVKVVFCTLGGGGGGDAVAIVRMVGGGDNYYF